MRTCVQTDGTHVSEPQVDNTHSYNLYLYGPVLAYGMHGHLQEWSCLKSCVLVYMRVFGAALLHVAILKQKLDVL